jgi:hypothetical protein
VKAKVSATHFEKLLKKLSPRLNSRRMRFPTYVKVLYDQKEDLKTFVWELVKRYNKNEGGFIGYLESNMHFMIKTECRKKRKFIQKGRVIVEENTRLYREPHYSMVELLAEKEAFNLACKETLDLLTGDARRIFEERINPSRITLDISIEDAFSRGGCDSPVRLKWKHIAKSLKISYVKLINTVNHEIIPKAYVVFRKYGFNNPYEYRDGIPQKMTHYYGNFPSQ